jgi:hypothetical protein
VLSTPAWLETVRVPSESEAEKHSVQRHWSGIAGEPGTDVLGPLWAQIHQAIPNKARAVEELTSSGISDTIHIDGFQMVRGWIGSIG